VVYQLHAALADAGRLGLRMGHPQQAQALLLAALQQLLHRSHRRVIERSRGLIEQQHLGLAQQSAQQGQALALARG